MIRTLLTKRSLAVVAIAALFVCGLVASSSFALGNTATACDPTVTDPSASNACPVTTTSPSTTATTDTPTTSTEIATTNAVVAPTTTTQDTVTMPTNPTQAVTQTSTGPTSPTAVPDPTATCTPNGGAGGVIPPTCGNNAATQVAVVVQNCNADSSASSGGLNITITKPDGSPVLGPDGAPLSKTISSSICFNYNQIYQVVQQICVQCQLFVQNYYTTNNSFPSSTTNVTNVVGYQGAVYYAYCMPKDRPVLRGDGTSGWLVFLTHDQAGTDKRYTGATAAPFDPTNGYTCPGTGSAPAPNTFTLTVPQSLIGQYVNLCIQPGDAAAKPICHSVKIDASSTLTLPVSKNVTASITKKARGVVSVLGFTLRVQPRVTQTNVVLHGWYPGATGAPCNAYKATAYPSPFVFLKGLQVTQTIDNGAVLCGIIAPKAVFLAPFTTRKTFILRIRLTNKSGYVGIVTDQIIPR